MLTDHKNPVFDQPANDLQQRLDSVSVRVTQQALDNGLYKSMPANHPEHPEWFIHEYSGGRTVLVEIDADTGKAHFLKEL